MERNPDLRARSVPESGKNGVPYSHGIWAVYLKGEKAMAAWLA